MDSLERQENRFLWMSNRLVELAFENQGSLQKALLTLSGGSIALSVTLISRISHPYQNLCLLHWAWYLFIFSILSTLSSFYTRMQNAYFASVWYESLKSDKEAEEKANKWGLFSKILLGVTSLSFIVGLILLTRFCLLNLSQK